MDPVLLQRIIDNGGVFLGVGVVLFFAWRALELFKPLIQQKLANGRADKMATSLPTTETFMDHFTRERCVPADMNLRVLARQIDELWAWHNKTDPDGVRLWYIRPTMVIAIESLAESQTQIARLLERLESGQEDISRRLTRLEEGN
jgi:hypothetical protein